MFVGDSKEAKSQLCKTCYEKVKAQFIKDEEGKIVLEGEMPKLCDACKKKMYQQFNRSVYPDRDN